MSEQSFLLCEISIKFYVKVKCSFSKENIQYEVRECTFDGKKPRKQEGDKRFNFKGKGC